MDFPNLQDMVSSLPLIYLVAFVALLAVAAVVVTRQVLRNRSIENDLGKLEKKVKSPDCTAEDYYALASIYLDKKLFVQAVILLNKALSPRRLILTILRQYITLWAMPMNVRSNMMWQFVTTKKRSSKTRTM
jgi:hypothetical protein